MRRVGACAVIECTPAVRLWHALRCAHALKIRRMTGFFLSHKRLICFLVYKTSRSVLTACEFRKHYICNETLSL